MNNSKEFLNQCLLFKGDFGDKILGGLFWFNILYAVLGIINIVRQWL